MVSKESDSLAPLLDALKDTFKDRLELFGRFDDAAIGLGEVISNTNILNTLHSNLLSAIQSPQLDGRLKNVFERWLRSQQGETDRALSSELSELLGSLEVNDYPPVVTAISNQRHLINKQSRWIVNADTLLDKNNSTIHQIVSSEENVNVLAIQTTPFDVLKTTQSSVERNIGLYAMNYGSCYVAAVCPSYSYAQTIQALKEADQFEGTSVVLAYAPNLAVESDASSLLRVLSDTKAAIRNGEWSLYRWHPWSGFNGEPKFTLDSVKARNDVEQFLERNSQLSLILEPNQCNEKQDNSLEAELQSKLDKKVQDSYDALFSSIDRKKVAILFGSDGGNAEGLAKRVAHEAKEKGLLSQVLAMDAFIPEDFERTEYVIFIISTAGQGEFPSNSRETWKFLSSPLCPALQHLQYSVFALGDSHYWPRPEDKHFFVKSGKDLDARLLHLGAKPLVLIGIGDDRDPDGFYTGFHKWIPDVWNALGVNAEPRMSESTVPSDDAIKEASNFLRGTIADGLLDTSTGALAEYDTKLTKFHGIYQQDDRDLREDRARRGLEKAFSFMVRVRVPGGIATPKQWLAIDAISDQYANGTIKITTRQAFQFHGILKSDLKRSIQEINKSLMDTIAACGDVNRNVMCNPNPFDTSLHFQLIEFANAFSRHLTPATSAYHEIWLDKKLVSTSGNEEPIYGKTYLPRKFKTAIAVPPHNDVDVFAHDLGYIAIVKDGTLEGFNVSVGGGMGQTHGNKKTYPMLGQLLGFCSIDKAVDVGEKILLVQRDYGDRANRKHARLKYTIEDRGLAWFKNEVETRLGYSLEPERDFRFESNGDRYGWFKHSNGEWSYALFVQNGRVKDSPNYKLKSGLVELAKIHEGVFALTPNQHLVINGIKQSKKAEIQSVLEKYKLENNHLSGIRLGSMACVALPTCALAMAESERYLPSLVDKIEEILDENGLRSESITVRMTGCPNGCARPQLAEIGFIGKAPGTYNMYLGGGFAGERLSKLYKESVDEEQILKELRVYIADYSKSRLTGEHFGDFIIRKGIV